MKKELFIATTKFGLVMATTLIFTSILQQQHIMTPVSAQVDVPTTEVSPAVNQTLQPPTENATNITSRAPENMTSE